MTSATEDTASEVIVQTWLVKQEPAGYPFSQLVKDCRTSWDGVRNAQARIHLRAMKKGDRVLYYHSGDEKAVIGLAKVTKSAYPDPTDDAGGWVSVEIAAERALLRAVTLAEMRADPAFDGMLLLRHSRLSVMPVEESHSARILTLSERPVSAASATAATATRSAATPRARPRPT